MFGLGMFNAYGSYVISWLGGMNASALVAIVTRILVGISWYFMFKRAGVQKPYLAFVPIVGPFTAFRLVWDDFSMAAIFASTTLVAFVDAMGIDHPVIRACAIANFIMWWLMALLTSIAYKASLFFGFLYGGVPWLGSFLFAFWPSLEYKGAWSTDPEADQNLTPQERKKRRRKAERAAKAAAKK
jgi:hypothetical protein